MNKQHRTITHDELVLFESGLCTNLPKDFRKWSEKKLYAFVAKNACEPYHDWDPKYLYETILDRAGYLKRFLENKGIEVLDAD